MQERRYFGTDGIRGKANAPPMTAEVALKLGMSAGQLFLRGEHRHRVLIAKDTRLSGYLLEPALTAGFIAVGMDVVLAGPLPTPAVAMLTPSLRADLGVMLSASHNPYEDNGIKLFGPDGLKLSDGKEAEIEALMQGETFALAPPSQLGRARRLEDAKGRYIESVKRSLTSDLRLDGLRIVLDCAHGAAYQIAPAVLFELGAEVIPLGVQPDGFNINQDCGSTHPEAMCALVRKHQADLGIALDGDADRVVLCDEHGALADGDRLIALIATHWQRLNRLKGEGVVVTEMSNLGFERYIASLGLTLHRTRVGDRYVAEAMRAQGCNLGGEQSGHVLLSDYCSTGDGLIAALQVIAVMLASGERLSQLLQLYRTLPQLLHNVRYLGEAQPLESPEVRAVIAAHQKAMQGRGRLLVRKSGTEAVIRIMAEGDEETALRKIVQEIAAAIEHVSLMHE
jgi:phosphoglucosamine mutase